MKKIFLVLTLLVTASCAVSAKKAATLDDYKLCYIATTIGVEYSLSARKNAKEEVKARKLDCGVHYAAIKKEIDRKRKEIEEFNARQEKRLESYARTRAMIGGSTGNTGQTKLSTKEFRDGGGWICKYGFGLNEKILLVGLGEDCPLDI